MSSHISYMNFEWKLLFSNNDLALSVPLCLYSPRTYMNVALFQSKYIIITLKYILHYSIHQRSNVWSDICLLCCVRDMFIFVQVKCIIMICFLSSDLNSLVLSWLKRINHTNFECLWTEGQNKPILWNAPPPLRRGEISECSREEILFHRPDTQALLQTRARESPRPS